MAKGRDLSPLEGVAFVVLLLGSIFCFVGLVQDDEPQEQLAPILDAGELGRSNKAAVAKMQEPQKCWHETDIEICRYNTKGAEVEIAFHEKGKKAGSPKSISVNPHMPVKYDGNAPQRLMLRPKDRPVVGEHKTEWKDVPGFKTLTMFPAGDHVHYFYLVK